MVARALMRSQAQTRLSIPLIAAICGSLTAPNIAWAYLDSAPAILEGLAARRARLALFSAEAYGYRIESETRVPVWTAMVFDRGYRTEVRRPESTEVELRVNGVEHRFDTQEPSSPTQAQSRRLPIDPFFDLLLNTQPDPNGQRGMALLSRMRINPAIVSLSRHEGRPVLIIGAAPGQENQPQLWIDKELYTPVRWIFAAKRQVHDVRLYGYHQPTTGPWFPERIEEWTGSALMQTTVYTRLRTNPAIDVALLLPPSARARRRR